MFKKKKTDVPAPLVIINPQPFPSGTVVQSDKGLFYIKNGKRFRVSTNVAESWRFPRVVSVMESALAGYKVAGRLGFREGSLLKNIADGKLYLISENKTRHIVSTDSLKLIGAETTQALLVSADDLKIHQEGEELNVRI